MTKIFKLAFANIKKMKLKTLKIKERWKKRQWKEIRNQAFHSPCIDGLCLCSLSASEVKYRNALCPLWTRRRRRIDPVWKTLPDELTGASSPFGVVRKDIGCIEKSTKKSADTAINPRASRVRLEETHSGWRNMTGVRLFSRPAAWCASGRRSIQNPTTRSSCIIYKKNARRGSRLGLAGYSYKKVEKNQSNKSARIQIKQR